MRVMIPDDGGYVLGVPGLLPGGATVDIHPDGTWSPVEGLPVSPPEPASPAPAPFFTPAPAPDPAHDSHPEPSMEEHLHG